MAKFGEELRTLLADVAKFVFVTLKHVQLPADASAHRTSLSKHLDVIKDSYPQLAWDLQEDEGLYASMDVLSPTASSGKFDGESPLVAAKDLRDAVMAGYLTRKLYKLKFMQLKRKKLWCIVKKGVFYMYEKQDSLSQVMSFPLRGSEVKYTSSRGEFGFEVIVCGEKLTFTADDELAANSWLTAIRKEAKTEPDARVSILYQSPDELDFDASSGAKEIDANNIDPNTRFEARDLPPPPGQPQSNPFIRRAAALPSPPGTESPGSGIDSSEQRKVMRPPVPSPTNPVNDLERLPHSSNGQSVEDDSIYEDVNVSKQGNQPSSGVQRQVSDKPAPNVAPRVAKQPVRPPVSPKTGGGGGSVSNPPVLQRSNTQGPGQHHANHQKTENGDPEGAFDLTYDDVIYEAPPDERPPIQPAVQMRKNSMNAGNAPAKRQSQPQLPVPAAVPEAKTNDNGAAHIGRPTAEAFIALWDCQADADNELTFKAGDQLFLISKEYDQFGWWACELHKREPSGNVTVRTGLVPKDFVRKL